MADKQISELTAASNLTDSTLFVVEQGGSSMKANWSMIKKYISPGIAPLYSNSSTYAVGDYVLYQDTLYRCKTAITTAESWTASHWTQVVLAGDITDLKNEVDSVIAEKYSYGSAVPQTDITQVDDKKINPTTKVVEDKPNSDWTIQYWVATEAGRYAFKVSRTSQQFYGVYSASPFDSGTYQHGVTANPDGGYFADMEAGQCLVISNWYASYTTEIKPATKYYDIPSIDQKIKAEENRIFRLGGYLQIIEGWERGGWSYWNTKDSRTYRARLSSSITFDRDVTLMTKPGFYVCGIYSNGSFDNKYCVKIPKNKAVDLYVRRITENTSEVIDVDEFASQLLVSTALSPIELYTPTFTDVSMFERIGICGDSYAGGGGIISGVTPLTWGKNLARQAGITADIYARSGESIHASNGWNYDNEKGLPALLAGTECGLYWMAHGINSSQSSTYIGTPDDMVADPLPYTFYGQYVYAINAIKTQFPKARIVIATVTGSNMALYQNPTPGYGYGAINTAIRNIAEFCDIPLIDLADDPFYWSTWYENHIRENHPTAMQFAGMAMANRRLLAKCIMDNPSYFVNYGT